MGYAVGVGNYGIAAEFGKLGYLPGISSLRTYYVYVAVFYEVQNLRFPVRPAFQSVWGRCGFGQNAVCGCSYLVFPEFVFAYDVFVGLYLAGPFDLNAFHYLCIQ